MKTFPPVLCALALQISFVSANDQIVTLGDSLTYAYESEFCFQKNITPIGSIGDGFGSNTPAVRNWIEILSNPTYRGSLFELGVRDNITVTPPFDPAFDLYFRQSYNWAIPGLKIHGLRQFLEGTASFTTLIGADTNFSTLGTIFSYSNFNNATDFALTDLENQIQTTAERLTIFIGGNDLKAVYGTLYDGGSAGTFVADYMADATAILDRVLTLNPNIQVVVVNVPHVGITENVRTTWPYDAVKTERVSVVVRDLNSQLAALAKSRNVGYADVCSATIALIDPARDLCMHGSAHNNIGSTSAAVGPIWLNGPISKNFHPNTSGQIVIANEIIDAFNARYNLGIAPLSATEIIKSILAKPQAQLDLSFTTWMTRFQLTGQTTASDADGDGITAGAEFALGLDPNRKDANKVSTRITGGNLELAYPMRISTSPTGKFTFQPASSTNLSSFTPMTPPTIGTDGFYRVSIPLSGAAKFMRLETVVP